MADVCRWSVGVLLQLLNRPTHTLIDAWTNIVGHCPRDRVLTDISTEQRPTFRRDIERLLPSIEAPSCSLDKLNWLLKFRNDLIKDWHVCKLTWLVSLLRSVWFSRLSDRCFDLQRHVFYLVNHFSIHLIEFYTVLNSLLVLNFLVFASRITYLVACSIANELRYSALIERGWGL